MTSNREQVIRESLRQSEEILRSQLTIALASDARALTFCGLTLTAASLLVGLADQSVFAVGMYVAAGLLYLAAGLAGWNAMPVRWYAPGQPGRDFADDVSSNRPILDVIADMVRHNDRHFDQNEAIREMQNWRLWNAARIAIFAAPVGLLVQVVAWTGK